MDGRVPCSGRVRVWEPGVLIFRVLLGPIISLLAGDMRVNPWVTPGDAWSSPKSRRLALPATGELYRSWTDNGEGGTSGKGGSD